MSNFSPTAPRPHAETLAPHAAHAAAAGPPRGGLDEAAPDDARRSAETGVPRALVVDDAPDVAEMVTILLRHAGYEVETALSARDALEAARGARFDVVVSDIGMPEMNGYELAERLRSMPEYASIPMVAVTGFTMYDDRARAHAAGYDGFLTKPINTRDLVDLLARLREQR
ncbi:MAG TPA: response regulator [Pyrinomonadaceae bacterium]|nr:response regulator [Pyrinomonadaceae bacterium]